MPEENRFFRFVWRVNAILLVFAGLLVIGGLATVWIENWMRPSYEPSPQGHYAPVPKSAEQNYTYRLEPQPNVSAPAHEQIYSLHRWNGSPRSYGLSAVMVRQAAFSSSWRFDDDTVDLLAINTVTSTSHWLFSGYSRAVVDQVSLYTGGPRTDMEKAPADPVALVIRTVDRDTNGDGQLDSHDMQSLYVYRPGDTKAVKFFEAEYILSMQEVDDGDFFVVYEKGASAFAATFRVPDFKLKSQRQLPSVPQ